LNLRVDVFGAITAVKIPHFNHDAKTEEWKDPAATRAAGRP